jgi:molybdate transport system ATP-binding protein
MDSFISLHHILPRIPESPFSRPIDWQVNKGEIWTILGNNGSGKSVLADTIRGRWRLDEGEIQYHFYEKIKLQNSKKYYGPTQLIKLISFESVHSVSKFGGMYYQQRFNSQDADLAPYVSELFDGECENEETAQQIIHLLKIEEFLNQRLIELSSGELRKLVIAKILLAEPHLLIIDNPFAGLDADARKLINEIFPHLNEHGIQLIFLTPSVFDIPSCTTHILNINHGKVTVQAEIKQSKKNTENLAPEDLPTINWDFFPSVTSSKFDEMVNMNDIEISYGKQVVNSGINWRVKSGENWALLGSNGSGKSTLLSYIFADNPQAYAKNLSLFEHRRGTGESIWDIKKRIGFISSEMYLYYRKNLTCLEIVESGFFDSIGLYRECSNEQQQIAAYILDELGFAHLGKRSFLQISSGEQRLVLFARALVKNPDLLVLDEPFQGLDEKNKKRCTSIIESYCRQPNKSLIFVSHYREEIPSCVNKFMELPENNSKRLNDSHRND